ncbi:hypothetical protein [Paraburkholderia sp. J94]|uniref:hypothetical protein n=1 Tax=Paraburkholderia sp. J94 TaxID=2805441 RepID=UPI002AAF5100|nr:hypothetical protein [Paraburkholderia sp. J94]
MSETSDMQETKEIEASAARHQSRFWAKFIGFTALGAILAIAAVAGSSSVYCDGLGETVFWTILLSVMPVAVLALEPSTVLWPLAGYLVAVFLIARYTKLRPTALNFGIAFIAAYALGAGAAQVLGWTHGVCRLV